MHKIIDIIDFVFRSFNWGEQLIFWALIKYAGRYRASRQTYVDFDFVCVYLLGKFDESQKMLKVWTQQVNLLPSKSHHKLSVQLISQAYMNIYMMNPSRRNGA